MPTPEYNSVLRNQYHNAALSKLADDYIAALLEFSPQMGAYLGLHEYDGLAPDRSAKSIARHVKASHKLLERAAKLEADPSLDPDEQLDLTMLRLSLQAELQRTEELRLFNRQPILYNEYLEVSNYILQDYKPLAERIASLIEYERSFPATIAAARANLDARLPQAWLEQGLIFYRGQLDFLSGQLAETVRNVADPKQVTEFEPVNAAAAQAVSEFVTWLEGKLADADPDFALGGEAFTQLVKYNEGVDLSLDELIAAGEADLKRNEETLRATAAQIDPKKTAEELLVEQSANHSTEESLLADTTAKLERIRQFIIEHDIISIPNAEHCKVIETPPYMRYSFAFMYTPGPFEQEKVDSYYFVTPVEQDWSEAQKEQWLRFLDHYSMQDISIHEAYPGHYVHFMHANRIEGQPLRKMMGSYAFIEGWAHYCEQMMLEQGYSAGDPHLRMAQLRQALVRDCRYIVAMKMHGQGMSLDQATQFLMQHAFMDELPARTEARRGTFDFLYFGYTLGKLLILKLRRDLMAEQGAEFDLKQFHDKLLSYGAPQVPLVRRMMLADADAGGVL